MVQLNADQASMLYSDVKAWLDAEWAQIEALGLMPDHPLVQAHSRLHWGLAAAAARYGLTPTSGGVHTDAPTPKPPKPQ